MGGQTNKMKYREDIQLKNMLNFSRPSSIAAKKNPIHPPPSHRVTDRQNKLLSGFATRNLNSDNH